MRERSARIAIADVIGSIYDAGLEATRWSDALEAVSRACGGVAAQMSVRRPDGEERFGCVAGIPSEAHAEYIQEYAARDLRFTRLAHLPKGVVYRESDLITEDEIAASPIYNELLPKYDINAVIVADLPVLDHFAFFSVLGPGSLKRFSRESTEALRRFLPHLRRSVEIQTRLVRAEEARRATYDGLDALPVGLVFLDRSGQVRFANRRALQIAADLGVKVSREGIEVPHGIARARLADLIRQALRTASGLGASAGGVVRLPHDDAPLAIRVVPLPSRDATPRAEPWSGVATMVVLGRAGFDGPVGADALQRMYDLTTAEAEIAACLLGGQSLETIARDRGVSLHTVRKQTKAIFEKSRTSRQAEFVARAWAALSGVIDPGGE